MSATAGTSALGLEKSAPETLDVVEGVAQYVNKILDQIKGMKVLLLDKESTGIVSMVYTQSQILEREVYLTRSLEGDHERSMHLKAVVLVRPTHANLRLIMAELAEPKYGEYHLFFTNMVRDDLLQQLASADEHQAVKQVQEYFADFYATTRSLFTLNIASSLMLSRPMPTIKTGGVHQMYKGIYQRSLDGLSSVLLAFKKRPSMIRFARASPLAQTFARDFKAHMDRQQELFDFRQNRATLLLVLDRRDDPVTPLLTQWTYQAMVHELLGMENNKVDLGKHSTTVSPELETVVLSQSDPFFDAHMGSNYGDLCDAVKGLLDNYQKMTHSNKKISTIEDMQRFVESFPELKKVANNTSKHVAIVSELSRLIGDHDLMQVSQLEQELACASDHSTQLEELKEKLMNPRTAKQDAIRLVLLYALRYEKFSGNKLTTLKSMLRERCGASEVEVTIVDKLLRYAGSSQRGGDLFGDSTLLSKSIKMATRAVKGVSNVYTQHKPVLAETLDSLVKGRLKESNFPFLSGVTSKDKTMDVFVFMLGGTTFEEANTVNEFNRQNNGFRVVLGGTCIHNSQSFLGEVQSLEALR